MLHHRYVCTFGTDLFHHASDSYLELLYFEFMLNPQTLQTTEFQNDVDYHYLLHFNTLWHGCLKLRSENLCSCTVDAVCFRIFKEWPEIHF